MIENYSNVCATLNELRLALKLARNGGETYSRHIEKTGLRGRTSGSIRNTWVVVITINSSMNPSVDGMNLNSLELDWNF